MGTLASVGDPVDAIGGVQGINGLTFRLPITIGVLMIPLSASLLLAALNRIVPFYDLRVI